MNRSPLATLALLLVAGCAEQHTAKLEQDKITLTLHASQARVVYLLASYDHFKPRPAVRDHSGTWQSTGLPNIDFTYFYQVDGATLTPNCRFTANDDFGTTNCRHIPRIQQASK